MFTLYGSKGCGSVAIEAGLALAGVPFTFIEAEPWTPSPAVDALRELNPLCQVPTLVLPEGTIMTESVAILMWLDAQYPHAGLLPVAPTERAIHLRWLVYLAANNYPAISIGDFPERWISGDAEREQLKIQAKARLQGYWQILETHLGAIPDVLGTQAGALSVLITTMSYWRPGRAWFNQHCPHLLASIRYTESDSRLTEIWARNFSG
jgi:GST-like protein